MANFPEQSPSSTGEELSAEKVDKVNLERKGRPSVPENIKVEVEKSEEATHTRVGQLVEGVRSKVGPAAKEVLSDIRTVFAEKARQLRLDFEMKREVKRRVDALNECTVEQGKAHLAKFFGYEGTESAFMERVDLGRNLIQKFFEEHRAGATEIRRGKGVYAENNHWIFYGRSPQGERFSIELFRQEDKFNSIDIRKLVSKQGEEPRYAEESVHLIVNPNGKFERGVVATGEGEHLIPAGETEVLLTHYLQNLEFDAEGSRSEQQRLRQIEAVERHIELARTLGDRLQIAAVGEEARTQIKVALPDGKTVKVTGSPQQSYLELLEELTIQNPEVAKTAGIIITEI